MPNRCRRIDEQQWYPVPFFLREIEKNINKVLGRDSFHLKHGRINCALNEARRFLKERHGKVPQARWDERIVYAVPKKVSHRQCFALRKILRYSITPDDPDLNGKEWYLLKTVSEHSQGAVSPALASFILGSGDDLRFNDRAIPSALLAHFVQRDAEVAAAYAQAA